MSGPMVQEFKNFITKGNVVMLAVGFIMGVIFQAVVSSLVEDVIMPLIAIPFGQPDFSSIVWTVNGSEIMIGSFITALVVFLLTALAVFLFIVKPYNAYEEATSEEEEEKDSGPTEIELLQEIRDTLRAQRG